MFPLGSRGYNRPTFPRSLGPEKGFTLQQGSKIIHSLHGIGTVESVEEKIVLGQPTRFSISSFGDDGLKIMINLDRKDSMVRPLIEPAEIPKVLEHLETWVSDLPSKAPTRYSTNLNKLKTGSIYSLCEVIKGLTTLSEERKLSPKDQTMLEKCRKHLAEELGLVRSIDIDQMEQMIDETCRSSAN